MDLHLQRCDVFVLRDLFRDMTTELAAGLLFCVLLWFPAKEDWDTGYISDRKTLLLAAFGFLYWLWTGTFASLWATVLVFLFFGILFFLFRGAMGSGDIFLAGAISLWLSPEASAVFVWLSFLLGAIGALVLILFHVKQFSDSLCFAPFLCAAGAISYFIGEWLWDRWLGFF